MVSETTEPQVTLLSRLTLNYFPDEDRIKLTGLTQEGALVVAWLSLRLFGRIVPHLLARYEVISASTVQTSQSLQQTNPSTMSGGLEAPVLPQHDTPSFLVGSVDMTQGTDATVLTLRGEGDVVRFSIPAPKMAHWLSGLKHLYQLAEWPMSVWQGVDLNLFSVDSGRGSVTLH